ncbi:MAG: alpha/beta hydrolase [Patescibacteria group bacterium]|jgi:hypothetical protein
MQKILLIHGYATKLKASIFKSPYSDDEGFTAFHNSIDSGEIDVFHWGIPRSLSFIQALNPFSYLSLYQEEELRTKSSEIQQKLFNTIESSKIEKVICHSMGCRLLLQTINAIGLPGSVQSIIFLQADIDGNATISNSNIANRLSQKTLTLKNFHCFWDPTLLISSLLHKNIRIGLRSWNQPNIKNQLFPLLRLPNLHMNPLRNKQTVEKILRSS